MTDTTRAERVSGFGRELMENVDDCPTENSPLGWIDRGVVPDADEAIKLAADWLGHDPATLEARAVLMRMQSEVEARIEPISPDGDPCYVECTKRARHPERYWRIELLDPAPTTEEGK